MITASGMYLYEQLANELANDIRQGVYAINERLPSLRRLSAHYKVSLATAILACQRLEDEGLLAVRPRSGYFVQPWTVQHPREPEISRPSSQPTSVNVGQLALSLVSETKSSNLVKLGAAVPDAELLPLRSLSRHMAGICRREWLKAGTYEHPQGVLELRRHISRLMRQAGCKCTPNDIVITNGCLEALSLALRVVSKPGDTIAIESPTYFGVLQVMESLGLKALEIATHPQTGIDVDALLNAVTHKKITACILMPGFHNPLGSSMPDAAKKQVVELLTKANVTLIEDDVYSTLSYDLVRPKAAKAFDETGNVILCSSFSKTVAPGYRIGWLLINKHREQIEYYKFLYNISTAVLPQLALAQFVSKGGYRRATEQCARIYRRRMENMRKLIVDCFPEGTRMASPKGGFVLWVELPKTIDSFVLYQKAMEKRIAVSPGILFSVHGQYRHHLRMSCGAIDGNAMHNAIKTIGRLACNLSV